MILGVINEQSGAERRVALVPESVTRLAAGGFDVRVEAGTGAGLYISDDDYRHAGAHIEASKNAVLRSIDLMVKVQPPSAGEIEALRPGATLICLLFAESRPALVARLAERGITTIALEKLPRTTATQAMDVLSSQSTAAGYRAVIAAANALAKFFPMLMTPAGTIAPARVLVVGAGVAGLQAIATARRLGAVVEAFDVRAGVREDVESLGARFLSAEMDETVATAQGYARELSDVAADRARAALHKALPEADVCITTALVPDRPAPVLLTTAMVQRMRPGSVIVDLAAGQGGNCELTEPGKAVTKHGITIIGRLNLAAEVGLDASRMYSRNIEKLIGYLHRDGPFRLDFSDEVIRGCVLTQGGKVVSNQVRIEATTVAREK